MVAAHAWIHLFLVAPAIVALALLHGQRALGLPRALAELAALTGLIWAARGLSAGPRRLFAAGSGALAEMAVALVAAAVLLCAVATASRTWWGSVAGRTLSASLVFTSLLLTGEVLALRLGLWRWEPAGAFLGVPLLHGACLLAVGGLWIAGAELTAGRPRASVWRAAAAAAALAGVAALSRTWAALGVETRGAGRPAWAAWAVAGGLPALVALSGRAAVLPETLGGLLATASGPLAGLALVLAAAVLLLDAAALGDPMLVALAAAAAAAPVALLPRRAPLDVWRRRAFARLAHVQDFVGVLMKPRNGLPWTAEDRRFLRQGLRTLARWAPGFLIFLLPGGMVLLGVYAWLLDRRRRGPLASAGGRETDAA